MLGDRIIEQKGPMKDLVSALRALKIKVADANDSVVVMQTGELSAC